MTEMSKAETRRFLMQGTFAGKLATVKEDGSSHVAPIWFVLDHMNSKGRVGDINFYNWQRIDQGKEYSSK